MAESTFKIITFILENQELINFYLNDVKLAIINRKNSITYDFNLFENPEKFGNREGMTMLIDYFQKIGLYIVVEIWSNDINEYVTVSEISWD